MATKKSQIVPLEITPGVQPNTDRTPYNTPHYTFADKVRFWRGVPQKIGGWQQFQFENGATLDGVARTLYSAVIANTATTIIGTSWGLYALFGQVLTNITPLNTSTTAISASLSTDYATLGSNPIATQNGTGYLTITDSNYAAYQIGDDYTLSGATTTNGITNTIINAQHIIRSIGTGTVTVLTGGTATSTGSGGGASVVRSTGLVTVAATAHGQPNGNRTKIASATAFGGITTGQINAEFIVRGSTTNTFQVMTTGTATSHVTAAGGTGTTYQTQLVAGNVDQSFGIGYGLGLYGAGLYGTSKMSGSGITYPQIWFMDRFGDKVIMTPGNQLGIYVWDGNTAVAPTLLTNAPTAINYLFVSDNILITFGYENVNNQIFTSDIDDPTNWTASNDNQVFQDVIYGAAQLVSNIPVLGINLLFTNFQTYTFSYTSLPGIWNIQLLDNSIGIIASMARCSVNNVAYWMGQNNFYYWAGGNVSIIPANSQDQCTMLNYVFGNLNTGQISKAYAWYNPKFNEVWFHYPSANSDECDMVARVTLDDMVWSPDTLERTCAEYPQNLFNNPRLIDWTGNLWTHELGTDAGANSLPFTLTSNLRTGGKDTALLSGFVPDSLQASDINVTLTAALFPQTFGTPTFQQTYDIADNAPRENIQIGGRFWQYEWQGDSLGQNWVMGSWFELLQDSAAN